MGDKQIVSAYSVLDCMVPNVYEFLSLGAMRCCRHVADNRVVAMDLVGDAVGTCAFS